MSLQGKHVSFFPNEEMRSINNTSHDELMLLCGIMIEAAAIDGKVDENEIFKIKTSLVTIFHENTNEVEDIVSLCLKKLNELNSLHFFTSKLNRSFDDNKKIILLEVLWEIILADKKIHDFESNFIRRLSGLMYISNIDCVNAKKRVLKKLKIK